MFSQLVIPTNTSIIHSNEHLFECELCEKKFNLQSSCIRHQLVHTKEKKYKCDTCHENFALPQNLKEHIKTHTGERNFICVVCDKSFARSNTLKRHSRVHTGEKMYKCDICGKSVAHLLTLNEHKRIHTGEKPLQCPVCGKKFAYSGRWKKHKMLHTNDRPHKCKECPAQFVEKSPLTKHIYYVHTEEGKNVRKQKEHKFNLFLQQNGIECERNVYITFSCFETSPGKSFGGAYIDFVIEKGTHRFALELDEYQHKTKYWYYAVEADVERMKNVIKATTISETKGSLVWIRFNPDSYTIDGEKSKEKIIGYTDRKKKLMEILENYVPTCENEIIYMYYNVRSDQKLPEICSDPNYPEDAKSLISKCIF